MGIKTLEMVLRIRTQILVFWVRREDNENEYGFKIDKLKYLNNLEFSFFEGDENWLKKNESFYVRFKRMNLNLLKEGGLKCVKIVQAFVLISSREWPHIGNERCNKNKNVLHKKWLMFSLQTLVNISVSLFSKHLPPPLIFEY